MFSLMRFSKIKYLRKAQLNQKICRFFQPQSGLKAPEVQDLMASPCSRPGEPLWTHFTTTLSTTAERERKEEERMEVEEKKGWCSEGEGGQADGGRTRLFPWIHTAQQGTSLLLPVSRRIGLQVTGGLDVVLRVCVTPAQSRLSGTFLISRRHRSSFATIDLAAPK